MPAVARGLAFVLVVVGGLAWAALTVFLANADHSSCHGTPAATWGYMPLALGIFTLSKLGEHVLWPERVRYLAGWAGATVVAIGLWLAAGAAWCG